jgi:hypothetical protein
MRLRNTTENFRGIGFQAKSRTRHLLKENKNLTPWTKLYDQVSIWSTAGKAFGHVYNFVFHSVSMCVMRHARTYHAVLDVWSQLAQIQMKQTRDFAELFHVDTIVELNRRNESYLIEAYESETAFIISCIIIFTPCNMFWINIKINKFNWNEK